MGSSRRTVEWKDKVKRQSHYERELATLAIKVKLKDEKGVKLA
jgi:hypothetical protein